MWWDLSASVCWKLQSIWLKLIDFDANSTFLPCLSFKYILPENLSNDHWLTTNDNVKKKRLLTAEHIPFDADDLMVLICNSNVKHELSSSEYPTRRKQCNEALKLMGLKSYREANLSHLKGELMEIIPRKLNATLSCMMLSIGKLICKCDLEISTREWIEQSKPVISFKSRLID